LAELAADFPPWLLPLWQRAFARDASLPHAILLCGAPGSGKRLFAEQLARALLCEQRTESGFACGHCGACTWFAAANHPDMHRMVPAADEAGEEEGEADSDSGKKEKKKSQQILIDQVREMQSLLEVSGHQGGRRVVLIDPAEAMNPAAANALLKSLEEPAIDAVFLLVCHAPRRLLPTIRSRCQVWNFERPAPEVATQWLQQHGAAHSAAESEALLGFASGLPLAALEFVKGPQADARSRFAKDMLALPKSDPLKLAAQWDTWLKAKDAEKQGLSLLLLVSWLQRWLSDGARLAAGGKARFFRDFEAGLLAQSARHSENWISCYNELLAYRRVAQHPLNARLFLEDVLLRVARALNKA
jgi:DNA polymerase III subunit delta'